MVHTPIILSTIKNYCNKNKYLIPNEIRVNDVTCSTAAFTRWTFIRGSTGYHPTTPIYEHSVLTYRFQPCATKKDGLRHLTTQISCAFESFG